MHPTVVSAGSLTAGRRFEPIQERELYGAALAACASLSRQADRVLVVQEMLGPIGIPDLTVFVGDLHMLNRRVFASIPPLINQLDAGIAAAASARRSLSLASLARALGWAEESVGRRIPSLVKSGALLQVADDRFLRAPEMQSAGWLYAVEAKVRDRRSALQQARTYALWADSYVVVMGPLTSRSRQALREDVQRDNGGAVVDGRWLRRPRLHRQHPARRMWAAEHLVAALRAVDYQPSDTP